VKKYFSITMLIMSPILAQCDWNYDGIIDVLDVVSTVSCIMDGCSIGVGETVTDIDGNVYITIVINGQEWMAQNLKVTHYRNGDEIPTGFTDSEWGNLLSGAYADYNNNPSYSETFGKLYNWYAIDDSREICPQDYHVPTDEDYMEIEIFLGMGQSEAENIGWRGSNQGGKLKESLYYHWYMPNEGATNVSNFTALPGGCRDGIYGEYDSVGLKCYLWTSTSISSSSVYRFLHYSYSEINRNYTGKRNGYSVRCLKD
jgi:uncharacterized protein (TIGR02145 family)